MPCCVSFNVLVLGKKVKRTRRNTSKRKMGISCHWGTKTGTGKGTCQGWI